MAWKFVPVAVALVALGPFAGSDVARANALDPLVAKHSAASGVPESLIRRVIHIESKGNPRVVSKGNYGLMQIRLGTAKAMGYSGDADGLLDADTNMTYAVRYLAGALRAADGNHEQAIRNYQRGYYDRAKARGFSPYAVASAPPPQAAAPDPTLVRQQQEADRRRAADEERKARQQAAIEQQKAAEQSRIAERQAMQQQRAEQRRAEQEARASQRQAAVQERADRQQAQKQKQIEQQQMLEQKRAEQRQAALQQRKQEQDARQNAAAPVAEPAVRAAAPKPSAAPRRTADSGYSWYNPMRYFTHPMHKSHPMQRER